MRQCILALAFLVGVASLLTTPAAPAAASAIGPCSYVVRPGDWLAKIAAQYGFTWWTLYSLNRQTIGSNPSLIYPGMVLDVCPGHPLPPPNPPKPLPPPTGGAVSSLEFCHSTTYWPATPIALWEVPVGCYANIYFPNPRAYPYKPGYGWCSWWPQELHPSWNIWTLPKHRMPRIGAVVWFPPGDQGASSMGHWGGEVIAIRGSWLLVSEMNNQWRGGGFGRVDYRYVFIDSSVRFVYP